MRPVILRMHFPVESLPVEGYRCETCGEEGFLGEAVARAQKLARRLGLYGAEHPHERRLVKNGSSLAITLDRSALREILGHDPQPGEPLVVGRVGPAIVIEAPEAELPEKSRPLTRAKSRKVIED